MHTPIRFLLLSLSATALLGQQPCSNTVSANNIRINRLVIESNSLPEAEREQIIRLFQQKTYPQTEIGDRIRIALRSRGYFKAVIQEPNLTFSQQEDRKTAEVTVQVEPGAQYRLREIHFQNATIFPSSQLREQFSLHNGDILNVTKVGEGLENLRELYATRGYVDFVATPEILVDESNHTIDLHIAVDEGSPFNFGELYLEGVEPHAGASKALRDSWKPLEGKRYSSLELQHWFTANRSTWHASPQMSQSISFTRQPQSHLMNVTLTQPCR